MAVTTDYLNELINQKTALATAISNKGITASASEKFNTLVPKVEQINTLKGEEVVLNNVTEALDSPQSVVKLEYPIVKNLIHYTSTSATELNGITFTYNSDGSITANGTATADVYYILDNNIEVSKGTTYTLSGCTGGSSATSNVTYYLLINFNNRKYTQGETGTIRTFTVEDSTQTVSAQIFISSGYTVNNVVFKPMLNVGDEALSFELYPAEQKINVKLSSNTLTDLSVVTVTRCGKNIFNPNNWTTSTVINGVTYTYYPNEDLFLLNGTATAEGGSRKINPIYGYQSKFIISTEYVSGTVTVPKNGFASFHIGKSNTPSETATNLVSCPLRNSNTTSSYVGVLDQSYWQASWFYVTEGVVFDNYKVKIQVECSDVASSYSKFTYKTYTSSSSGEISDISAVFPYTTLLVDKPANFSSITGQFYKEISPSSGKNGITKIWQPSSTIR